MLCRNVAKKMEGGVLVSVIYDVEDDRCPVKPGSTRISNEVVLVIEPKRVGGTGAEAVACVLKCVHRTNPRLGGAAKLLQGKVAEDLARFPADLAVATKREVQRCIIDYTLPSLEEVTFTGFDHQGKYDPFELTGTDMARRNEVLRMQVEWWSQRMNPKMGWKALADMDVGVEGWAGYDEGADCGE